MDDATGAHLAAACSRSAVHSEAFLRLREVFPDCKLLRLSFGLQNKVMLSITVDMEQEGRTHASYVPIHPTAAAAAVLQNNSVVVVRQEKRSPLWDQEDLFQREGCSALSVVSMPFYWPPRPGAQWDGTMLPVPQNVAYHPTFGALTAAGNTPLTQHAMNVLLELAAHTGRHVCPHISMLLSSLEAAGLLPTEADAQLELELEDEESEEEDAGEDEFGFEDAQQRAADADTSDLLLALGPPPPSSGIPCCPQQRSPPPAWMVADQEAQEAAVVALAAAAAGTSGQDAAAAGAQGASGSGESAAASSTTQTPLLSPRGGSPVAPGSTGGQQPELRGRWEPHTSRGPHPALARLQLGRVSTLARRSAEASYPPSAQRSIPSTPAGQTTPQGTGPRGTPGHWNVLRAAEDQPLQVSSGSLWWDSPKKSGMLKGGFASLSPWSNLTFQPEGLEQAFITHYSRGQERADLITLLLLIVVLTASAALHVKATYPAGLAAMLLFAPYFIDPQLYQSTREKLLTAILLLLAVFLSSLSPPSLPLAAITCASDVCDPAAGARFRMEGFGICWFLLHNCGMHYLIAAPLLLRLPMKRALPVQAASLAMALYRLPAAYSSALGRLDTVHVLLLGMLLAAGTLASMVLCHALEQRQREAWLIKRVRRGEGMSAAGAAAAAEQ